ncbi:MAG: hypothetical protein PHN17_09030, partial [Syntrophaceticus sp.]|nr:hypothetical protein [Syntrophaceticus sp.]
LFLIALSEGYHIKDIARAAKISPKEIRRTVLEASLRAKKLALIPEFDDPLSGEVNKIAH